MDLSTTYLGLKLRTPLVPSASNLTEDVGNIKRMEDAGASAIVLHSLFEEQFLLEEQSISDTIDGSSNTSAEALSYFPEPKEFHLGTDEYLKHIAKAKKSVGIPIIASLNGTSVGHWVKYAKKIQQAGADALELNIYYIPTNPNLSSEKIEQVYLDILTAVKKEVSIPVAVKLSPFFTNMANMAARLDKAGANGLVLFNRFYQPDVDLETLEVKPQVLLSTAQARRLPLRWIAMLYGNVKADLAATSGIHSGQDALKMLMAGASVTMLCSVLYKQGIDQIRVIEQEMKGWMLEHEYESIQQLKGSLSQQKCPHPSEFERAHYMRGLHTYKPV